MALVYVTGSGANGTAATSFTLSNFNNTGAAADMIIVGVCTNLNTGNDTNTTTTYGGDALTKRINKYHSNTFYEVALWTRDGSLKTGNNDLVLSGWADVTDIEFNVIVVSGHNGRGNTSSTAESANGTSSASTLTTANNNSWHISLHWIGGTQGTSSSDSTIRVAQTGVVYQADITTDLVAIAGSDTNTITWSGTQTVAPKVSLEVVASVSVATKGSHLLSLMGLGM